MSIVKKCKKHGDLTENEIRIYIRNRRGRSEKVIACKECHRETASRSRNLNREKANEWARKDRKNNPEKYREQSKKYKKKNWQKISVHESLRKMGITNEQYSNMLFEQDNKCAICKKMETKIGRGGTEICRLSIDHDHVTLRVRALLCHNCNVLIGHSKESILLLENAIFYLKKYKNVE